MQVKTPFVILIICYFLANYSFVVAQNNSGDDYLFNAELEKIIKKKTTNLGKNAIPRERFIVQQMRMLNDEIKSRISNAGELRKKYFDNLESRLSEIDALKSRLSNSGARTLIAFINDLETRIESTIESGRIDYKRQKVFEDGIQLLYIAEEMVNLDPSAQLENNPQISKSLESSKQKFINTFGESATTKSSGVQKSSTASIFNLFKEWQLTNTYKYEVRWTDVQIIKNKLLMNGTAAEKNRMLQREIEQAGQAFNFGYYDLADRSFGEIINRYDFVVNKDDLFYYRGEAIYNLGQYNAARDIFTKLVDLYPTSSFATAAYSKLIFISFHFEEYDQLDHLYSEYERVSSTSNPDYYNVQIVAANAAYNLGNYENAVNIVTKVNPISDLYYDAQMLLGKSYAGAENFDQAEAVFNGVLRTKGLDPELRFNVLLKLAFINYEKESYFKALAILDKINSKYSSYDQVLITYSWTNYRQELAKPLAINRDFSKIIGYIKKLTKMYPESDYTLEAKTLLGYVYQTEERVQSALGEYNFVYNSRFTKKHSDQLIGERDSLKQMLKTTERLVEKALKTKNKAAFYKAKKVNNNLSERFKKISYTDISSTGVAARNEVKRVARQIKELDRISQVAELRGETKIQHRAKLLRRRLVSVLKSFPITSKISPLGINYFDEHPLARKESVIQDQNAKVLAMRERSKVERKNVLQNIDNINGNIEQAREEKDYKELVHFEIQKHKFDDLEKKLDYLESYSYTLSPQESFINLQKWSDFGGFGIANVNFAIKSLKSQKVSEYSDQISKINSILDSRKRLLDYKIQQIEGEISLMTRKVRQQERLREREELNRKFEESYFDTHTTEVENSNVLPPEVEDN